MRFLHPSSAEYPNDCTLVHDINTLSQIAASSKIGMIAAIENASGFCEEDEPLKIGFERSGENHLPTQNGSYILVLRTTQKIDLEEEIIVMQGLKEDGENYFSI